MRSDVRSAVRSFRFLENSRQIQFKAVHSGFQPLPTSPVHSNGHQLKELFSELAPAQNRTAIECEIVVCPETSKTGLTEVPLVGSIWKSYVFLGCDVVPGVFSSRTRPENAVWMHRIQIGALFRSTWKGRTFMKSILALHGDSAAVGD